MSKLSLTLCTFSVTGSVAGLFLTQIPSNPQELVKGLFYVLYSLLHHLS